MPSLQIPPVVSHPPDHWAWYLGKTAAAIQVLVTDERDARHRVWSAADYIFAIRPDTVPPDCREDVEWILHMLTCHPAAGRRSASEATFERTRNRTASKIAAAILRLHTNLRDAVDDRQRSLAR